MSYAVFDYFPSLLNCFSTLCFMWLDKQCTGQIFQANDSMWGGFCVVLYLFVCLDRHCWKLCAALCYPQMFILQHLGFILVKIKSVFLCCYLLCVCTHTHNILAVDCLCEMNLLFEKDPGENSLASLTEWISGCKSHSAESGAWKSRINAQGYNKKYLIN